MLHLPDVEKHLGPLWAISMYPFESQNRIFRNSCGILKQIQWRISIELVYGTNSIGLNEDMVSIAEMWRLEKKCVAANFTGYSVAPHEMVTHDSSNECE